MRSQAFEDWLANLGYWECESVGLFFVLLAFAPFAFSRLVMLVIDPPRRVARPYRPLLDEYLPLMLMVMAFVLVFPIQLLGAVTAWGGAWPRASLREQMAIGALGPASGVALLLLEVLLILPRRKRSRGDDALELPPEIEERLTQLREERARGEKAPPGAPG